MQYNTVSSIIANTNPFHATRPTQVFLVEFDSTCKYAVRIAHNTAKWFKVSDTSNLGIVVQDISFLTPVEALKNLAERSECVFSPYENGNIEVLKNKASTEFRLSVEDMEVTDWLEGVA